MLLKGGVLPETEMLNAVDKTLSADTIRPLTDKVTVHAPQVESYDVDISYWINLDDQTQAAQITEAAQAAVEEYIAWQSARIGRDIVPDELIYRLKAAGVKRLEVRSPTFRVLDKFSVAQVGDVTAEFMGVEEN